MNLRDIRVNRLAGDFPDETGVIQIGRVGTSLIRERRDDPIDPHSGSFSSVNFGIAHRIFGSEVNFTSLFAQTNRYRPLSGTVLATSLRFGWNHPLGETRIPITERYFAGGSTTLRGFDLDRAVIVWNPKTAEYEPKRGGNVLSLANVEWRFPIPVHRSLGGALFYDTGTFFDQLSSFQFGDFTHTAGFGLRFLTGVGPVRVDLGYNLNRKPGEPIRQFFFTLGHTF